MLRFQQMHMSGGRGEKYIDLGYIMVACPHKRVFVGRGPGIVPAANGPGLNSQHYAVLALVGDSGFTEPNDDLLCAICDAIDYLRKEGGAGREAKGHRDGYATSCPGAALYRWVKAGAKRPMDEEPAPEIVWKDGVPRWPGRMLKLSEPYLDGEDIEVWQAKLAKRGGKIDVDGVYGPQSRSVCRSWQRAVDLPVTGEVDKVTWDSTWAWAKPSA
ncbi:peptidoglycan-binding domain-containing protein [Nonomuraea sp. NPDC055795]